MTDERRTVSAEPTPAAMGIRDVLRLADFRRLWLAQSISDFGDGLTLLTLMLLVNQLTGSTLALAAVAIALAIPPLTIGLVAGAYVDRWDRRRIMLVSDSLRAIVVLGFVFIDDAALMPLILVLAFVQASIGTFFTPARGALVPRVVPASGLLAANSITQATRVIAGVIGSAAAGIIVGVYGVTWPAFALDSLTFIASVAIVYGVSRELGRPSQAERVSAGGTRAAMTEGLRIVGHSRALSTTLLALAVSMLGLGAVNVLFLPLLVNVLDVSPVWLGLVDVAQSASMILAAGLVAVLAARLRPTTIVTAGIFGVAILIGLTGAATSVWHVVLLLFGIGWFITPLQAAVVTIFQTGVEDSARGRVMAILQAAMSGASIASMALAGIFGELIGIRSVFFLAAIVCGLGGVVAVLRYRGLALSEPSTGAEATTGEPSTARAA
ncbi:MAG: MFS transporter [Candidatus Limnocylindrales bacterium]